MLMLSALQQFRIFTFDEQMATMTEFPLRRAQIVAPSGAGSLQTSLDGITGIICGIDHWMDRTDDAFERTEFEIRDEWRLCEALGVNYFVRPPDYRRPIGFETEKVNMYLTLPALRFPLWHWCRFCTSLDHLEDRQHQSGKVVCRTCDQADQKNQIDGKKWKKYMIQVAFLAMCEAGHLEDFPFREWVHRNVNPDCKRKLTASFSGATLEGQIIKCECGAERNLGGIFGGKVNPGDQTYVSNLSKNLDPATWYTCRGRSPWLDDFDGSGCGEQLVGGLTGAVNVYYPYVQSAIFLPNDVAGIDANLLEALTSNGPQVLLRFGKETGTTSGKLAELITQAHGALFKGYTVEQVAEAIESAYLSGKVVNEVPDMPDDWRLILKAPEYRVLCAAKSSSPEMLKLSARDRSLYDSSGVVHQLSNSLALVERMRETRALTGFGRVKPNPHLPLAQNKALLRKSATTKQDWLPAYEVFGEGIFIDFNSERFKLWSQRPDVIERVAPLRKSEYFKRDYPNCKDDTFLPRFVALHSLSHVLINQLVFDCGYTAASLRERLYCSDDGLNFPAMNGFLIYTASGDSEGSMGGLVRMGEPSQLDRVCEAALDHARFCSSDPICMELGAKGQGPNSMNLAACHSCALVPETSCEYFNHYLDRGLLVGIPENPGLGYFNL
jgi:hypothetical protein